VKVTVTPVGDIARMLAAPAEVLSNEARRRLVEELERELEAVAAFDRAADPEVRRDALERAVRRVWGRAAVTGSDPAGPAPRQ
jgi:hypothetical protein